MIEFSTLTDKLIKRLEAISPEDLYFHIVSDTGEYKSPSRKGNIVKDYINGVLSLNSSDISNLTDGTVVATQTARLDLLVRLPDITADEQWNGKQLETINAKIDRVRAVLNILTQESTFEELEDNDHVTYAVSTIYQNAVSGERNIVANVGDSYTFTIYVYYILIQGGVNTKSLVFNIDGVNIPFQAVTMNRSKTFDSNVFSNTTDGSVKSMAVQANWSVTFELPAIQSDFYNNIINFLFAQDKLNTAHCLSFSQGGVNHSKLVSLAEVNLNGETIKNAGLKITFFESVDSYYLIALPNNYELTEITEYKEVATIRFADASKSGFVLYSVGKATPIYIPAGASVTFYDLLAGDSIISSSKIIIT